MNTTSWLLQEAMVVHFQTEITPANGYTYDLSKPRAVTNEVLTIDQRIHRMAEGSAQVQIEEGNSLHELLEANPDTRRFAGQEIILSCLIKGGATDEPWRKRLNLLVGDVNIGLHQDQTVGSTVSRARVIAVDEPKYNPDNRWAHVFVRIAAEFQYTAGVEA